MPQPTTIVRNQFGASLGGPIHKNRAFILTNCESLRESRSVTASLTVPRRRAHAGRVPSATDPASLSNIGVDPRVAPFLSAYPMRTQDTGRRRWH